MSEQHKSNVFFYLVLNCYFTSNHSRCSIISKADFKNTLTCINFCLTVVGNTRGKVKKAGITANHERGQPNL